jgi:hypothetical protein
MKKVSVDLFRAAPYMLLLVLHKDALFQWNKKLLTPVYNKNYVLMTKSVSLDNVTIKYL